MSKEHEDAVIDAVERLRGQLEPVDCEAAIRELVEGPRLRLQAQLDTLDEIAIAQANRPRNAAAPAVRPPAVQVDEAEVLQALRDAEGPISAAQIAAEIGDVRNQLIDTASVSQALRRLLRARSVEQHGQKRGAKYTAVPVVVVPPADDFGLTP
ncbi:MAG: hypothetical protein WC700_10315 [Gemmatimonadaceae bacterium]